MALQPDLMGDVVKFLVADFVKPLAARLEFLVNLDGFLGHLLVRVPRSAHEREVRAFGDALVSIGIESESEHHRFAFPFSRVRHGLKLEALSLRVKAVLT